MSRRSDRFKKILPTDVRRGLDINVSTKPAPNFEVGAVQGDSVGAAHPRTKKGITHTEFRVKLDFTVRVDGDQVMPDAFGPKYMNFIAAGLRATMLQEPTYAKGDLTVDVLPGSGLSLSVKRIKEK